MSVKILLADDSPTVHKVIKIILKDESYEIVECAHEDKLSAQLKSLSPQIVFLDFNFSEKHSGYELAQQIKKQLPHAKILIMYGTFDTVDESLLKSSGVDQFVVKPFDTAKFKVQVRGLADGNTQDFKSENLIDDSWTIKEEKTIFSSTNETRSLEDDLGDWGMAIPGVIGLGAGSIELPPVIDSTPHPASAVKHGPALEAKPVQKSVALPQESDLEYPDMSLSSLELEPMAAPKTSSKLISLDDLALDEAEPLDTGALLELSQMDDTDVIQKLEEQIRDEVEADLWSVDSVEESTPRLSVVKEVEEDKIDFSSFNTPVETMDGGQAFDENIFSRIDENESLTSYNPTTKTESRATSSPAFQAAAKPIDLEDLRPMIKELINQAVADYCRQHIDKVAWEVIPDLAENLIKQELKKISDKVSRDL